MPCGDTGGALYESRSLRKGRPSVRRVDLENHKKIFDAFLQNCVLQRSRAIDGERSAAMWGHSYTLILGLLVGHEVGANVPPHSQVCFQEHDVDKNQRRSLPTIPRPSTADTRPPGHGHVRCLRDPLPCTPEVRSAAWGHIGGASGAGPASGRHACTGLHGGP